MSKDLKLFVYYFIQNDAFDGLAEPNIYALPNSYTNINQVKAEHVYNSFPLKFENFYLRFFLDDKVKKLKAWMDFPPSATLPVYGDKVYVKVLRMPKNIKLNFKNDEDYATSKLKKNEKLIDTNNKSKERSNEKYANEFPTDFNANSTSRFNSTGLNSNQMTNSSIKTDRPLTSKSPDPKEKSKNRSNININLISIENQDIKANNNNNQNNVRQSNFNIEYIEPRDQPKNDTGSGSFIFVPPNNSSENENNFSKGIFAAFNNNNNINNNNSNAGSTNMYKGSNSGKTKSSNNPMSGLDGLDWGGSSIPETKIIEDSTSKQVIHDFAKSNISKFPIDNIPNQLDDDTMKEQVNAIIKNWSFGVNERKNLRFLLATFYEVWTNDPMWKEVSMQKLLEDEGCVKTYYKKALGQTHPDKNRNSDRKIKYLADCLYNILTQAKVELPK